MPADLWGVALKETDYIAFECQPFDAFGVGFYKIVMVDHLKKKTVGWPEIQFISPWTISR